MIPKLPIAPVINIADSNSIDIPLRKGLFVAKLIVPKDVNNEDLDKISKFIDALRD